MLRPATPLTVLFFVAFVLLLLSTISTPIVKAIPLASFNGVTFGVFGYCKADGSCSKIQIGYSVDAKTLFGNSNDNSAFTLPSSTRSGLSSILIVHPVAALLTLICFILAATSHLHSPSHSPRYLLALIILSVPTLLITLLAFLVDILLFVPHLAWGGWIVLASTILILASGIVTCIMRRTLVSRKARKKRIAENAEMNGESFYARQAAPPQMVMGRAETPPPLSQELSMSGGLGSDKLPKFATFETNTEEDRVPLNQRTPSNKTLPSNPSSRGGYSDDGFNKFGGPGKGAPRGGMRGGRGGYNGRRDEYGNPLPPSDAFGPGPPPGFRRDQSEPPRMRRQYSDETMNSQGSRGRGRGGFGPPRGYGRGGPGYGPGPHGSGRGGYGRGGTTMGPMAAGAGAGMMAGEFRRGLDQPGLGYGNGYPPESRPGQYDGVGPAAGYGRSPSAPGGYGRRASPSPPSAPGGYGRRPSPGPPSAPGGYGRRPSPGPPSAPGGYWKQPREPTPEPPVQPYRGEPSPPLPIQHTNDPEMIGQAVEMDARHGSPSLRSPTFPQPTQLRDSDSDVQGFVGLQQQGKHRDLPMSLTSMYSNSPQEPYVPPRAGWTGITHGITPPSDTIALDPVELPTPSSAGNTVHRGHRPRTSSLSQNNLPGGNHRRNQSSADNYYEDVDPRFASPESPPIHARGDQTQQTQSSAIVPTALMPGLMTVPPEQQHQPVHPTIEHIDPNSSYESIQDGQRSPASDMSGMSSISQRGINPNWRPGQDGGYQQRSGQPNLGVPSRRAVQQQQQQQRDVLLNSNPDFDLGPGQSRLPPHVGGQPGQAY